MKLYRQKCHLLTKEYFCTYYKLCKEARFYLFNYNILIISISKQLGHICVISFSLQHTYSTQLMHQNLEKNIFFKKYQIYMYYIHVQSTLTWSLNLWFDISQIQEPYILKSLKNDSSESHFANLNFRYLYVIVYGIFQSR